MHRNTGFLILIIVASLACGLMSGPIQSREPDLATTAAETMKALPTTAQPALQPTTEFTGTLIEFNDGTLTIPPGLGSGASETLLPPASEPDVPPWEVTPGHSELTLEGYPLQGTFHTPKIYVFPAQTASLPPGAQENIPLLSELLANPAQLLSENNLPSIPIFNAGAVFAAQEQNLRFQNGAGVRMVTQYAQSFAKVNNQEVFYHFQGLSNDRTFYVIVILPINAPILPSDSSEGAVLPPGGVPFPDYADPNADFESYYAAVRDELNRLPPDGFNPPLNLLDILVASLQVTTP